MSDSEGSSNSEQLPNSTHENPFEVYKRQHPNWYYEPPDHPSWGERFRRPYVYTRYYMVRVTDKFGWRFLVLLTSAYFGVKGFLYQLLMSSQLPFFLQYLQVPATHYQIYGTVATTPWSMKALIGFISDCFPIRGFFKKHYLSASGIVGLVVYLCLGFGDMTSFPEISAVLFCIGHLQVALVDLLVEGRYAELMVEHPESSSDIVSWVWASYFVGSLVATWVVGPLGDSYISSRDPWYIKGMFIAAAPFAFQITIPCVLDYLGEVPIPRSERGFQWDKWHQYRRTFILALVMGIGAIGLAVVSLLNNRFQFGTGDTHQLLPVLLYAIGISAVTIAASYWALPRGVANALFYMFFTHSIYINIAGPLDVFYTSPPACVPDGPHFSDFYYITLSGTVSAVFGFVGVTMFQAVMSEWEFRPCFWLTAALQAFAGLIDIVMVERWNIAVGIPDKVTYMVGYNIIYQIIMMLNFMPGVVLISKLCPKGLESTLYALLAGFANFGSNISRTVGVYMIVAFDVEMSYPGPCKYSNLPVLIVIAHIVLPMAAVPATFFLIPKARLTDPLFHEELHTNFKPPEEENGHVEMQEVTQNALGTTDEPDPRGSESKKYNLDSSH
eukprot:comp19027_c0_seq1/m.21424 comp19027_c0_seq1/g.21424  ORF comp19027_c0_seq1/g.21424 comp19027_c0_seq1/m.21424 type:complete len:612 (-) comp19027_c0_seq1:50-1885(-)